MSGPEDVGRRVVAVGVRTPQSRALVVDGTGIPVYRLLVMRKAVQLEANGLRFKVSWTRQARREFNLGRRAKHADVVNAINVALDALGHRP